MVNLMPRPLYARAKNPRYRRTDKNFKQLLIIRSPDVRHVSGGYTNKRRIVNGDFTSGFRVQLDGPVQLYSSSVKLLCMGVKLGPHYMGGALRYMSEQGAEGGGCGSKRDEVAGRGSKPHSEQRRDLYTSSNIIFSLWRNSHVVGLGLLIIEAS
jgi:hypothetical protein